jgi:hypothetical protein
MADRLIEDQSPVIPQYRPKGRYPLGLLNAIQN